MIRDLLVGAALALVLAATMSWLAGCSPSEPYGHAAAVWHRGMP